jgi:putative ATPase
LLILIGATTENPYYQVNPALISRTTVLKLELLNAEIIVQLLRRAIEDPDRGFGSLNVEVYDEALLHIANTANGDARKAYNALEVAVLSTTPNREMRLVIDLEAAQESIQKRALQYDKDGDQHYDLISAFIKSIRGSDPDAALHYLAKMLYGGEDPEFIGRRLIISASEDIGNADPQALLVAAAAHQAVQIIGLPEARINLAQATTYLAAAPKSNAAYKGIGLALEDVEKHKTTVPIHLRDASYSSSFGHGKGYVYPHSFEKHYVKQQYLPDELKGRVYYSPSEEGYELKLKHRLKKLKETE